MKPNTAGQRKSNTLLGVENEPRGTFLLNGLRDPTEVLLESDVQVVFGSVLLFSSLMLDDTKHLLVRYQLRYQVYRLFVALQEVDHHVVAEAHGLKHKVSEQAP